MPGFSAVLLQQSQPALLWNTKTADEVLSREDKLFLNALGLHLIPDVERRIVSFLQEKGIKDNNC